MRDPLSAQDLFHKHLIPLACACFFIWLFVVSVPVIYFMQLSPDTELLLFTLLFAGCHLANWPMLRLRSQLWFEGRLTPSAAMVTTALLAGSFGIPFILLVDMIG
ncbi:hypothetical protein BSZ35_05990 [Salinibacter sp. 10B]|uniref:hypothetical protein n=1 Tax=Salinibacter sp. 10B TaxID=1923971 RepID=UPI000CF401EE|nr:hypothetical protein [Salinibacter sp. 10B]PQJ34212.1 hypothetical protein BSZ35_05990 [Salinibacter sp. 10B]